MKVRPIEKRTGRFTTSSTLIHQLCHEVFKSRLDLLNPKSLTSEAERVMIEVEIAQLDHPDTGPTACAVPQHRSTSSPQGPFLIVNATI